MTAIRIESICMLITAAIAVEVHAATVDSSQIFLHYSIAKSTYLTGEPIFVSAQLENHSADTVRYETEDFWLMMITDEDGMTLPRKGPLGISHYLVQWDKNGNRIDPRPMVPPGRNSRTFIRSITDDYGSGEGVHDFYLPRGQYRIVNLIFSSDTVSFTVEDPLEKHEIDAMRLLIEAIDNRRTKMPDANARYQFYLKFYQEFFNTPYAERALRKLVNLYSLTTLGFTDSTHQEHIRHYILEYPRGGFILEVIPQLKSEFVPPDERDSIAGTLQTHFENLPSEVQVNRVRQELQELRK